MENTFGKKEDEYHFLFVKKRTSNARNTFFNELFQMHDLGTCMID